MQEQRGCAGAVLSGHEFRSLISISAHHRRHDSHRATIMQIFNREIIYAELFSYPTIRMTCILCTCILSWRDEPHIASPYMHWIFISMQVSLHIGAGVRSSYSSGAVVTLLCCANDTCIIYIVSMLESTVYVTHIHTYLCFHIALCQYSGAQHLENTPNSAISKQNANANLKFICAKKVGAISQFHGHAHKHTRKY